MDTLVSLAAKDVAGVNVALPPCGPPATPSPTVAPAVQGLEGATVSAACQDTGITARLAARSVTVRVVTVTCTQEIVCWKLL